MSGSMTASKGDDGHSRIEYVSITKILNKAKDVDKNLVDATLVLL
jgi:hypothetical protein